LLALPPLYFSAFGCRKEIPTETVEEPFSMTSLDHALANFNTDFSPWTSATDWLDADTKQVTSIIHEFVTWKHSAELENASFAGDMIYQVRSIVTSFEYLVSTLVSASACLHLCTFNPREKVIAGTLFFFFIRLTRLIDF
jgi:hypothetical protein